MSADATGGAAGLPATGALIERLRGYVEIETPSGDAARLIRLSERIEADLREAGATCTAVDAPGLGRNLVAEVAGRDADAAPIVLLAHIDTVHPAGTLEVRPFRIEDGRAYGPGVYDMKAGAALFVEALLDLRRRGSTPRRPVRYLVTCDEEIGSHSARPLIESASHGAAAAIVTEPCLPNGGVKTARKGVLTYRMTTHGRAAHAGIEPERSPSAIHELLNQLQSVRALADAARGTTINIGQIGGGTASNVIAAQAWAAIDVRVSDMAEWQRIDAAMRAITPHDPRARVDLVLSESRGPLVRNAGVIRLYEQARAIAAQLGHELPEGTSGGGSDGSIIAGFGVPTLDGLGPRGDGAHADHEHIELDDLPFRLALLTGLLETL